MIYLLLAILAVLPIIVSIVLMLIFKIDLSFTKAYIYEIIILFIVSTIGHFYYYQVYGLNYFPSWPYAKFFLVTFGVVAIGIFFVQLLLYWIKKKEISPFKLYIISYIAITVFFIWTISLMQKYFYTDRLKNVEETFDNGDPDKVTEERGIKVGLVASERDKLFRSPYGGSITYNNYMYVRNDRETPFTGVVYITLRNKNNKNFEVKFLEDIEMDAKSTQLLIVKGENKLSSGKWAHHSFYTDRQVAAIETKIVAE